MKKIIAWLVAIIVVAGIAFLGWRNHQSMKPTSGKPVVKIGIMLPLTGPAAEPAENAKKAIAIALDEAKDSPLYFDIIMENDTLASARAAVIANKFIHMDKVQSIVSSYSSSGNVVSPVADRAKILHIGICNDTNVAKGDLNYTNWQIPEITVKRMVDFLLEKQVKKVVLFRMYHIGFEKLTDEFKKQAKERGIQIAEFGYMPDNRDFSLTVYKASRERDADYWMLLALPPSLELIRREMIRKNITTPVTGIQTIGESRNPALFEGSYFSDPPDGSKDFLDKMSAQTQSKQLSLAAYFYDTVKLLIKLNEDFYRETGRVATSTELGEKLNQVKNYQGVVGTLIMAEGGIMQSPSVLKQIQNGKAVVVDK